MANLKFSSEILDDILIRAGELADGTSDFEAQGLIYLNRAHKALLRGGGEIDKELHEDWLWQRKSGTLVLEPKIIDGSVTVTRNLNTITFSIAPAASVVGWFFKVDSHTDWFQVITHTGGGTGATLDAVYTGATGVGFAYKLIKLEYTLASDFLRPFSPMWLSVLPGQFPYGDYRIDGIEQPELKSRYPLAVVAEAPPAVFAFIGQTKIRFNSYPRDLLRVEYDYLYLPPDLTDSGSQEPIVPYEDRHVLSDLALFFLLDEKQDARADGIATVAKSGIWAMAKANRKRLVNIGRAFGHIYARQGQMVRPGPRGYPR